MHNCPHCSESFQKEKKRMGRGKYISNPDSVALKLCPCFRGEGWNCPQVLFSYSPAGISASRRYYTVFFSVVFRAKDINISNREKISMIFSKGLNCLPLVWLQVVSLFL